MSIVRIALRMSAIQALKGRTLVGSHVLDSEIGSLQVNSDGSVRTDEDAPFITVYTDAAGTKDVNPTSRVMMLNNATQINFEAGITAAMTETDPDTDETRLIGIGTPATDQALEFHLDMVSRQIGDVLSDPENEWSRIYQSFIQRFLHVERARISNANDGIRLAGHQIKVTADLIADPVKGDALRPGSVLARFFAMAEAVGEAAFQAQISFMKAQLSGDNLSWQSVMRRYGMTADEANAMLLLPMDGAEADIDMTLVETAPAGIKP